MDVSFKRRRIYLRNIPEESEIFLKHSFTFTNPRTFSDPTGEHHPIRLYNELKDGLSFRVGLADRLQRLLRKDGVVLDLPSNSSGISPKYRIAGELDALQKEAVMALVPVKTGVLELSVGSGKTITMAALSDCYLNKHPERKVLIVEPKRQLMYQVYEEMRKFLPHRDIGMVGDGKRVDGQIIVAVANTVTAASDDVVAMLSQVCAVIIDEGHHASAPSYSDIIDEYSRDVLWGLSGKVTFDDKLETLSNEEVFGPPLISGRNEKRLCAVEILVYDTEAKKWAKEAFPSMKFDGMSAWLMPKGSKVWWEVKYYDNELRKGAFFEGKQVTASAGFLVYDNAEDRSGVLNNERNRWIADHSATLARRGKVIVVVKRGIHSLILKHAFKKHHGLDVDIIDGKVKGLAQQAAFTELGAKPTGILIVQQNVLKEGTNLPTLTDLVLASTTKNHQTLEQLKGRIERASDGKLVGRVHIPGDCHNKALRKIVRGAMSYYRGKPRLEIKII